MDLIDFLLKFLFILPILAMASQEPVERLFVSIEADVTKLLQQTADAVARVEQRLDDMSGKGKSSFDDTGKAAQQSAVKMGAVIAVVNRIVDGMLRMASQAIRAFINIGKSAIDANADMELLTVQFTTLLGSAQAAQERIQELIKFNIRTPFTLPQIVEASRVLQIFGGSALATGDNLELVGDIAAGVGRDFADVALWVGRTYDAFQSGRPFGIAGLALQRMGALTGQARNELERMQKAGASGEELWARFNELVGAKFAGNLDRMSRTLRGVISNLIDFSQNLLRIGGYKAFEELRQAATRLFEILQRDQPQLERVAKAFGEIAANVVDFIATHVIDMIENLDYQELIDLAESLGEMVDSARLLADVLSSLEMDHSFIQDVEHVADVLAQALHTAAQIAVIEKAKSARRTAEAQAREELGVTRRISPSQAVTRRATEEEQRKIDEAGQAAFNAVFEDALSAFEDYAKRRRRRAYPRRGKGAAPGPEMPEVPGPDEFDEAAQKLRDLAGELANDMLDAREQMNKDLEELEKDHSKRMTAIDQDLADDLAKLDRDTADRREEIFKDTRRDLAKLEQETDEKLAKERDDFQEEERRETEDHLRDMRRLTEDYLLDLEDAVKERDARAVVDLQRRFALESQRREEDFTTRQSRDREDADQRLAEIRDNEAQKRQELLQRQAEQLQDLADNEARKRQEIILSHQKQREQEMQSYAERQADLQNALAERLATIAKGLADEEGMNAEHARRLLEMLNETFGAGGDVDKLMADFANRRRQRMIVEITFQAQTAQAQAIESAQQTVEGIRSRIPRFQHGGTLLARPPGTLALFGETTPEVAQFMPFSQMAQNVTASREIRLTADVNLNGPIPPTMARGDLEGAISSVLVRALRESGATR